MTDQYTALRGLSVTDMEQLPLEDRPIHIKRENELTKRLELLRYAAWCGHFDNDFKANSVEFGINMRPILWCEFLDTIQTSDTVELSASFIQDLINVWETRPQKPLSLKSHSISEKPSYVSTHRCVVLFCGLIF